MAYNPSTHLVWLGTNDGEVAAVDPRAPSKSWAVAPVQMHDKRFNTISSDPAGSFLALASNGPVLVLDGRKVGRNAKALHVLGHSKSVQAAYFEPGGSSRLLTTCYDDFIRVWDDVLGAKPSCPIRVKHNNNTGRWVMPFRAQWGSAGGGFFIGSMNRELELYDVISEKEKRVFRLTSEHMTAIASRYVQHPTLTCVAAATSSGRVHLFR